MQSPPGYSQVEKKPSLEKLMADLIKVSTNRLSTVENSIQTMATSMESQGKAIQHLVMQMSQVATTLQIMQKGKFRVAPERTSRKNAML